MVPEISEFSYGFALTNELVGWMALRAAPIFPSLIEEGRAGGGYDVHLDRPGVPLFLQFKRADCLTRSTAREINAYRLPLTIPFYRFGIMERARSQQHELLVELDNGQNSVFYAAPRFHTLDEINDAWAARRVRAESIFIAPREIGAIEDGGRHYVSFDATHAYFCSEPRELNPVSIPDLEEKLRAKLIDDVRPLRDQITELRQSMRTAVTQVQRRRVEAGIPDGLSLPSLLLDSTTEAPPTPDFTQPISEITAGRALNPDEAAIREVADEALHSFNAQLVFVQPREP